MLKAVIVLLAASFASCALAADVAQGQRLAQSHCTPCHQIGQGTSNEVADAPPFVVISRRHGSNADAIASALAGPHPKMNFSPRPDEAADIAAYIATLGK